MPHITQIVATNTETGDKFNLYVCPDCPITMDAQRITGISLNNSTITVHGKKVESFGIKNALQQFCDWLSKYSNVCLVAHNGRKFDFPVLLNCVWNNDFQEKLFNCVNSLCDSLAIFRKVFPNECLKQKSLVKKILGVTSNAHNAVANVDNHAKLLHYIQGRINSLMDFTFSPEAVLYNMQFNKQKNMNIRSLDTLVAQGVFKRPTAENIAGSGLNFYHLRAIYYRSGEDGLRDVFTEKNCEGQPRVTNTKKTLDEVVQKLGDFFSAEKMVWEMS